MKPNQIAAEAAEKIVQKVWSYIDGKNRLPNRREIKSIIQTAIEKAYSSEPWTVREVNQEAQNGCNRNAKGI